MQPFPGDFPENPAFLLARAAAARSSESWGKGREIWHLGKTFGKDVTGVSCPSLPPAGGHEAGGPMFSSVPATSQHLPAGVNC